VLLARLSKEHTPSLKLIAGKVVNTALATAKDPKGNDVTDVSGTVDNNTPNYPLTQNPSIAL
jgi:hypothetical protein